MNHQNVLWKKPTGKQALLLALLGLAAGFLSGMFGVGGGILIVPGLIAICSFAPRLASGTSLTAIVPLALVGVTSYASTGDVSWAAAACLAAGGMLGAQLGTWLLSRINQRLLEVIFSGFILISIVLMYFNVPSRDSVIDITWSVAAALLILGIVTGTLSGLLGVGGGVIVVPALMLLFGASDVVAKGTSLLMMIPSALAGTVPNIKRRNMNLPAALIVGVSASATTYLGSYAAHVVSVSLANALFSVFLLFVAGQLLWKAWKGRAKQG